MGKVGLPRGLIAYDTDKNIACRKEGKKASFNLIRPRVILYSAVLALVGAIMLFGLTTRATIDLNVLRDRNPSFVTLSDGSVRNAYTVKILNRTNGMRDFTIAIDGPAGLTVKAVGLRSTDLPLRVTVGPSEVRPVRVLVTVPKGEIDAASMPITFRIGAVDDTEQAVNKSVFLSKGP